MGEFELIERIRRRLPQAGRRVALGSGDDAAVSVPGGATATSVDALLDGVHFRREWSSPAQIGAKALAVALSDLAAMGAEPGEAYVVLGVPPDLDEDACIELLDGMTAAAEATGTTLAGGDVTLLLDAWDLTTRRSADLRLAALLNDTRNSAASLGNAQWNTLDQPGVAQQVRAILTWLERTDSFQRIDAALEREEEPMARMFFEGALDRWIKMSKTSESQPNFRS